MYKARQVIAQEPRRSVIYSSISLVMAAYGLKSTSQVVRLIENEQNIPHTNIWLDWWDGEPVRWMEIIPHERHQPPCPPNPSGEMA